MITVLLILTATFLLALGGAVVVWFTYGIRRLARGTETRDTLKAAKLKLRWSYVIVPLVFLLLAIILAAFFYPRLPAEIAYHFRLDGSPDRWLSRELALVWLLVPQLWLTLLATAITWGIARSGVLSRGGGVRPERLLSLLGNIIGLPQFVIGFAMLDIFRYNAYQTHIMPIWIFALTAIGLGSIFLGLFFFLAMRQARRVAQ